MPRYLSNTDRAEETQHRVYVASIRSGQDVRYIDAPMPPRDDDLADGYYARSFHSGNLNDMGSLWAVGGEADYSAFWDEWQKLKGS